VENNVKKKQSIMIISGKNIYVKGNIYTNIRLDSLESILLSHDGITFHAKRDVFMDIKEKPNRMRPEDLYLDYREFIKEYPMGIKDILAFSDIFK